MRHVLGGPILAILAAFALGCATDMRLPDVPELQPTYQVLAQYARWTEFGDMRSFVVLVPDAPHTSRGRLQAVVEHVHKTRSEPHAWTAVWFRDPSRRGPSERATVDLAVQISHSFATERVGPSGLEDPIQFGQFN